jgi:hypothetical protein
MMKYLPLVLTLWLSASFAIAQQPADDPEIATALHFLNLARNAAGMEPVTISDSLSRGCYLHAKYLAINSQSPLVGGMEAHKENSKLQGHTEEGAAAGANSVIHYVKPSEAIVGWIATFYHRLPLLQPALKEIGIAYYEGEDRTVSLIDCISGANGSQKLPIVYYPGEDQADVPPAMGPEIPHPMESPGSYGFPITIYFSEYQDVKEVYFKLLDNLGKPVACRVSTPEEPATYFTQWNSICAIPEEPLLPHIRYTVRMACTLDGVRIKKEYGFTTGAE